MKAKELIEKLQELDPDEEIYHTDNEYGPQAIESLQKHLAYEGPGRGKEVWSVE